jgi:hypothetical protein
MGGEPISPERRKEINGFDIKLEADEEALIEVGFRDSYPLCVEVLCTDELAIQVAKIWNLSEAILHCDSITIRHEKGEALRWSGSGIVLWPSGEGANG